MTVHNIILDVKAAHIEDQHEQSTEFLTEGRLLRDDDTYTIEYQETELFGSQDTVMRLTVAENELYLTRSGAVESEFLFHERQMYQAAYETPFGILQLTILPTVVKSRMEAEEGRIDLAYVIHLGNDSAFNRLNIHYQLKS